MICTNEIHKKIYNGMKKACEVVKKTYGPNGRKIIIDNGIIDIILLVYVNRRKLWII